MFGNNLKALRLNHHLGIEKLAQNLNEHYHTRISKSMISRWENNQTSPQLSYVRLIADYFNVSFDDLIYKRNINSFNESAAAMEATYHIPVIISIPENNIALAKAATNEFKSVLADGLSDGTFFYTKMTDESMMPTIPANAMILVKEGASVINTEIVAVLNEKENKLCIRRFYQQSNNILLQADDHITEPIILNSTWPGKIIGRVIKIDYSF